MRMALVLTAVFVFHGTLAANAQEAGSVTLPPQQMRWISVSIGKFPPNAIRGGQEADGSPIYICRAKHAGGVHIGKTRADWKDCAIPFGGREVLIGSYEVAVN